MSEKIKISLPIIVEGRYDKAAISGIFDATVITTDGFAIFNSREKRALIEKISKNGIIVLTDSDAGGRQIRGFLSSILPKERIFNVYVPKIKGKESRKARPSKEGLLGVEGVGKEALLTALAPFIGEAPTYGRDITPLDFFEDGLSGSDGSRERRDRLATLAGLPDGMSAKALISALNLICGYDGYRDLLSKM